MNKPTFLKYLAPLALLLLVNLQAYAGALPLNNTQEVSTVTDELDYTNTDTSLREAIVLANAQGQNHVIKIPAGVYTLSIPGAGEDAGQTGDLDINLFGSFSITLQGQGCDNTIIDGGQIDRVLDIHSLGNITLEGLTIRNGKTPDGITDDTDDAEPGGGIRNRATLAIYNSCIVSNQTGDGADRPALDFDGGTPGNAGTGGGIWNVGTLTLENTVVAENSTGRGGDAANNPFGASTDAGYAGSGGGIYNGNILWIENSSISSNQTGRGGNGTSSSNSGSPTLARAGGDGAGIATFYQATLLNSTIDGNVAGNGGRAGDGAGGTGSADPVEGGDGARGGQGALHNQALLNCTNLTISGNIAGNGGRGGNGGDGFGLGTFDGADGGDGGTGGNGAGFWQTGGSSTSTFAHCTIATNIAGSAGSAGNGGATGLGGGTPGNPGSAGAKGVAGGMQTDAATCYITHLLAGDNLDGDGLSHDLEGFYINQDYNFIENAGSSTISGGFFEIIVGPDPQLNPLADNGGPTLTHSISSSSLALDRGDPSFSGNPSTDQRGSNRVENSIIDIGAYEAPFVFSPCVPVLHWPLNEGSGSNTLEDISGATNTATFIDGGDWGAAVAATGSTASADFEIDNPVNYISAGTLTTGNTYVAGTNSDFRILDQEWTLTAWVNLDSQQGTNADRVIASSRAAGNGNAWWLWFVRNGANGTDSLGYDFNSDRQVSSINLPRSTNVFIAISSKNENDYFGPGWKYRFAVWDGSCWSYDGGNIFSQLQLHDIELGSFAGGQRQFDGLLDDVRIYDKALDLDELDYLAQTDIDGDGMLDYLDSDDDNDNLSDSEEITLGTQSKKSDSDGDGASDGEEIFAGTDALNVSDVFSIVSNELQTNQTEIVWSSASNRLYSLWSSPDLDSTNAWTEVTNNISATPPENSLALPIPTNSPRQYYRVEVNEIP